MATALWVTVSFLIAAYLAWRINDVGFGEPELIGLILGGFLGLIQFYASNVAIRKTEDGTGAAIQRYMILSFSMKFIALIALGVFLSVTRADDGTFFARPDIAFMAYLGLVFLGFAWHGKLLEAPNDAGRTKPSRQDGVSNK